MSTDKGIIEEMFDENKIEHITIEDTQLFGGNVYVFHFEQENTDRYVKKHRLSVKESIDVAINEK